MAASDMAVGPGAPPSRRHSRAPRWVAPPRTSAYPRPGARRSCRPSERAHIHKEQAHCRGDRRSPGQGRYVEPRCPEQPFTRRLSRRLAIRPDSRGHAERGCDRAGHGDRRDPCRSTRRASSRCTSESTEHQDEPRRGCECDSSDCGVLRRRGMKPRPPRHETHDDRVSPTPDRDETKA